MSKFLGAWTLQSYQIELADGTVINPLGERPFGMFSFHAPGYWCVQLVPGEAGTEMALSASLGTTEFPADNPDAGTVILTITATTNPAGVVGAQHIRNFTFIEPTLLRMMPPRTPEGAQSTIMWRRVGV
jgi:hypothetical protein